jgi:hypothetical protein
MNTVQECEELIAQVQTTLMQVRDRLAAIDVDISKLQEQGVFDDIPTESWEGRSGGDNRYLRLVFPAKDGRRRRVYIGSTPNNIKAARDKIQRTEWLRDLQAEQSTTTNHLRRAKARLQEASNTLEGKSRW